MQMAWIPFGITDWACIPTTQHAGETGSATWRTQHFGRSPRDEPDRKLGGALAVRAEASAGPIRVRMVEYSPGYLADHWCEKGHILLCLEGELTTELADGRTFVLKAGMSYQVADGAEPHRSRTAVGAKLFIVD